MLTFSILAAIPQLRHAVTTRSGGISTGDYGSLNLAFHVGDEPEYVRRNRRLLGEALQYNPDHLVAAQQIHSADITPVASAHAGSGAYGWDDALPNTDALVTAETGLPLLIQVADCAPLLLVEPEANIIAVIHAGWRGAVAGIAGKTARFMVERYGAQAQKIRAGIGPCLCPECLEVGPEVAQEVESMDRQSVLSGWEKPHLDLRGLLQRDLENVGLPPAQIEIMDRCPRCETDTFFSHRGQNGKAGRFGLVAWMAAR
jgi:hypothetical protein